MTKQELAEHVAEASEITKAQAQRAVDAVLDGIETTLRNGEEVRLVGFGTFLTRQRQARTGKNPRTGEAIQIPASRVPAFKPGKALKDAVS